MAINFIKEEKISPTFADAQALNNKYFTLHSNIVLKNSLLDILDSSIVEKLNLSHVRKMFNDIILKHYPNETSVKSNFINQVLFKSNNHVTIFELPIGNSRIDLCKLNGSSIAYEIKTDLDNLSRLNKQLTDYLEIFEKVFVICSENKRETIEKQIASNCGIYTYTISNSGKYKFKLYRHASTTEQLSVQKQLNMLRKKELSKYFDVDVSKNRKNISGEILEKFSPKNINEVFKQVLKNRYQKQWDFLKENEAKIYEIDYQWFYKNNIDPQFIYS